MEAVLQCRWNEVRVPVKEGGCRSAHQPGLCSEELEEFEGDLVLEWPAASECPVCARHTCRVAWEPSFVVDGDEDLGPGGINI